MGNPLYDPARDIEPQSARTRREWIALRGLDPVRLVVNMYASFDSALRHHCGPVRGEYRRRGPDIALAKCANCDRDVTGSVWEPPLESPEALAKVARLEALGLRTSVGTYQEPGREFHIRSIQFDRHTMHAVRGLAIQDVVGDDPAAAERFVSLLNSYINQKYAYDWKDWAAREAEVDWPWFRKAPEHLPEELD